MLKELKTIGDLLDFSKLENYNAEVSTVYAIGVQSGTANAYGSWIDEDTLYFDTVLVLPEAIGLENAISIGKEQNQIAIALLRNCRLVPLPTTDINYTKAVLKKYALEQGGCTIVKRFNRLFLLQPQSVEIVYCE